MLYVFQGGFPLPLPTPPTDPVTTLPGVLCAPFYSLLQSHSFPSSDKKNTVSCYELFCVHVAMVPTQYALGHCRKLKEKLWKVSVDTTAPISLLWSCDFDIIIQHLMTFVWIWLWLNTAVVPVPSILVPEWIRLPTQSPPALFSYFSCERITKIAFFSLKKNHNFCFPFRPT